MTEVIKTTERTKIKRLPKRGNFERGTIYKILDEGFVCHVGFTVDEQPFVFPTSYARAGDDLLIHGSSTSRMMRALAWETPVCVTVTLIEEIVLAFGVSSCDELPFGGDFRQLFLSSSFTYFEHALPAPNC